MVNVVRCDNPRCTATYDVPSNLGGHTFTCNQCGSKVTVRDMSFVGSQPPKPTPKHHSALRAKTPLLDKIVADHERVPVHRQILKFAADYWLMILFVAVVGGLFAMERC